MSDSESSTKIGQGIPYLFYDVIARVVPGAFLIVGVLLSWNASAIFGAVALWIGKVSGPNVSTGVIASLVGTFLILFLGLSSFVGFLLSSPSNLVVERGLFGKRPLDANGLKKYLGADDLGLLMKLFRGQFGFSMPERARELNRASFLCAYAVSRKAPILGSMSGRFDADLVACQSSLLVSILLIVGVLFRALCNGFAQFDRPWLVILVAILISSGYTFEYLRRKRVYGRFALYLALNDSSDDRTGDTPSGSRTSEGR
jgi:hypothetical protein